MSKQPFWTFNLVGGRCALLCLSRIKLMGCVFIALSLWLSTSAGARAAEPAPASAESPSAEDTNTQSVLRSYLQLQEQIHANELAIERSRTETQRAAERDSQALDDRLRAIEQALEVQRAKELEAMQNANRVMLIVAGAFAVIGLLAMVLMAYFQWRTVNRLAVVSAALPTAAGLGAVSPLAALGAGESHLVGVSPAERSSQRLLGAMEQLDKRMQQIEHPGASQAAEALAPTNGSSLSPAAADGDSAANGEATPEAERIRMLLGKGQSLLNLDKAEEALACFEEVLALEPKHTEALLRKGAALERLRKLEEALGCYDRALEADSSLTIAHLYKGGLFNRMERFDDALACYEKALRTQEHKNGSASA